MTAFTPGPWVAKGGLIDTYDGIGVARVFNLNDVPLFLAAPDLYAEVERNRDRVQRLVESAQSYGMVSAIAVARAELDRIEALLKRARGEG